MAKRSGLATLFLVDAADLSGDVTEISDISVTADLADCTSIDKSAIERIALRADGSMTISAWMNPVGAHATLDNLPLASNAIASYFVGQTVGDQAVTVTAKQSDYQVTRDTDGTFRGDATFGLADGSLPTWGWQMTGGVDTFTVPANSASQDISAATTGGSLIVHCTAFTGTNITVTVEESSDNGAGDAFAAVAGGAVTFTGVGAQRADITATVERYVRVAISGTFTTADLAVIYGRGTF